MASKNFTPTHLGEVIKDELIALGISADLLMGLQADYTMQHSRNDEAIKRKLRRVRPYHSPSIPACPL